ncbi:hypothetical protein DFH27DRAFT_529400 [Peziza echinospora]|nr:hypothetical protein DFH27DRAFT_529400 [Peziza echinospora]
MLIPQEVKNLRSTFERFFPTPTSALANFSPSAGSNTTHAPEWSVWAQTLSLIYLHDTFPDTKFYKEYVNLIEAITLATQDSLSDQELEELQICLLRWIEHYKTGYHQFKWERLSATRYVFHMLAHVTDCIKWAGPVNVYSQ